MNYIVTKYKSVVDLLDDLVRHDPAAPTELIVCSTKELFLNQVLSLLDETPRTASVVPGTPPSQHPGATHRRQPALLEPTLHLLNAGQFVRLIFCSSISVLRAKLATYAPRLDPWVESAPSPGPHQLVIVDLLGLHHGTSEFTVQGLSHTFAAAASAARRLQCTLKVVEFENEDDPSNPDRGPALWRAQVPLLSGSIKIGQGGATWGRRTISVSRIASRWFQVQDE